METAKDHARAARALLDAAHARQDEMDELTPEDRLRLAAGGAFPRLNADLRFTVELAIAHALTSIALTLSGVERD